MQIARRIFTSGARYREGSRDLPLFRLLLLLLLSLPLEILLNPSRRESRYTFFRNPTRVRLRLFFGGSCGTRTYTRAYIRAYHARTIRRRNRRHSIIRRSAFAAASDDGMNGEYSPNIRTLRLHAATNKIILLFKKETDEVNICL